MNNPLTQKYNKTELDSKYWKTVKLDVPLSKSETTRVNVQNLLRENHSWMINSDEIIEEEEENSKDLNSENSEEHNSNDLISQNSLTEKEKDNTVTEKKSSIEEYSSKKRYGNSNALTDIIEKIQKKSHLEAFGYDAEDSFIDDSEVQRIPPHEPNEREFEIVPEKDASESNPKTLKIPIKRKPPITKRAKLEKDDFQSNLVKEFQDKCKEIQPSIQNAKQLPIQLEPIIFPLLKKIEDHVGNAIPKDRVDSLTTSMGFSFSAESIKNRFRKYKQIPSSIDETRRQLQENMKELKNIISQNDDDKTIFDVSEFKKSLFTFYENQKSLIKFKEKYEHRAVPTPKPLHEITLKRVVSKVTKVWNSSLPASDIAIGIRKCIEEIAKKPRDSKDTSTD